MLQILHSRCSQSSKRHHEAGDYTLSAGLPKPAKRPSRVPCPYCHGLLFERVGDGINRVIRGCNGDCAIEIVPVPSTHAVLDCGKCQARFTTLKATDHVG